MKILSLNDLGKRNIAEWAEQVGNDNIIPDAVVEAADWALMDCYLEDGYVVNGVYELQALCCANKKPSVYVISASEVNEVIEVEEGE